MGYRTSARGDQNPETEIKGDSLTRVDVSGREGLYGSPGSHGSSGMGSGGDGSSGGNAGPAEAGQNAGIIHALLSPDPSDSNNVLIGGTNTSADGHDERLSRTVALGDTGFIDLVARGGAGGQGGYGGAGGAGAPGSPGADATRYSSGSDGGAGGDGGHGGDGSSGANGGNGGAIIAEVAREDTHLLMLLRCGVEGGPGGAAGSNGAGGSGGSGGSGGNSYSWTESETYTDSEGQTQTRTTSHSNPGGSSGPSGRSGMPGNAFLTAGSNGSDGRFAIHVTANGQTEEYPSRYDLKLVSFEHHSDNDDGIYEPDEFIHITKIEVLNIGAMPTPATRKVELSLREQGWVYPEKEVLVLPFSLGPGKRHSFVTEKLTAKIGAFHPSKPSDPLAQEEVVRHRAYIPDVRREFTNYENHQSFELGRFLIRFPIESSDIESLYSLGPGQAARLRFTIKNASNKPYGANSEMQRRITFRLFFHESELGDEHVLFFDDTGERAHLSRGFSREIPELLPGQSVTIEGVLAIAENAPFYRAGKMWLSLELGSIADPSHPKPIQYRAFDVRVARPFERKSLGDVLLVVNNRTEAQEIEAWLGLFSALGLRSSVYDVSLEGGFDLSQDGDLRKDDLKGRTVVFLNQAMDTAKGERKSIHYASKDQLFAACAAGAHVHIVGEPFDLQRFVTPTFEESKSTAMVPASSAYLVPAKDKPRQSMSPGDAPFDLKIPKWSVLGLGKPTEKALEARAIQLHDALARLYPGRRHVLVYEFAPELEKDYFIASRWSMGRIAIHRSIDGLPASISAKTTTGPLEAQQKRILHRENILEVVLALPFSDKLERLEALTASMAERSDDDDSLAGSVVGIVVQAIVVDLVEEQLEALQRPWCQRASPRSLRAGLPHLREICEKLYASSPGLPEVAARAALVHLVSSMQFFATSQVSFWEWMPPFLFERRAPVLRGVTLRLIKECIQRLFGKHSDEFVREIMATRKSLEQKYKDAKKTHEWTGSRAGFARDLFLRPLANAHYKRSTKILLDSKANILSKQRFLELRAKDEQAAGKRRTLMKRAATAKDALLVDARCADLLAKAKRS